MKRLQKLILNIAVIIVLAVGLGYLNQYRLTPVSAAKLSGAQFFLDHPVATIMGYKDDYAFVLLQQDQNAACYPVKKSLGLFWKPIGYYMAPTTLSSDQDIDAFATKCLTELQAVFGQSPLTLAYPLLSSVFYPNSPNGMDFYISEVVNDSFREQYFNLMNTQFTDDARLYSEYKKSANIRTVLFTSSIEEFTDFSIDPAAIVIELERPDANGEPNMMYWYIQMDVNANLGYTVSEVYNESQVLKTALEEALVQYKTIEAFEALRSQELDAILEYEIAQNDLKIYVGAQTAGGRALAHSAKKEDYTDIRVFAEKEGWDTFDTDLTYSQMSFMTYDDIYEAVGANKNNDILIKTADDKYIRLLDDDSVSLSLTWLINEVTVDVSMNLRYAQDMLKVLGTEDYGSLIYEVANEQIKEANTYDDLKADAVNLRRALSDRFDVNLKAFEVSVYAEIKTN